MNAFLSPYFQAFVKPQSALQHLVTRSNLIPLSLIYISIPIVSYTLLYIFLTIAKGAPSTLTPWLNIPKEEYYAINRFLLAPSMIICWFSATSFMYVASRMLGGTGTFEQTLASTSLGISIAMWGALIHDLPMSFLSAIGVIDASQHEIAMNSPTIFRTVLWISYSLYLVAFLILFPLVIRVVHKLSLGKSIAIGVAAFFLFQVLFLVFNR